jgi:hypothetical protein
LVAIRPFYRRAMLTWKEVDDSHGTPLLRPWVVAQCRKAYRRKKLPTAVLRNRRRFAKIAETRKLKVPELERCYPPEFLDVNRVLWARYDNMVYIW